MLTTAFGMCAIPFCKQALLLTGLMSVIGMSMGVLDTGELKGLFGLKSKGQQKEQKMCFAASRVARGSMTPQDITSVG